jgi:hypothetical protein
MCCVGLGAGCISIPEFHGGTDAGADGDAPSSTSCAQAIGVPGLLVHLPFEAIASGKVEDASSNDHDGVVLGGAALAPGRHGMGIVLDGGSKAVSLGSPAAFDNLATMTVCAWVKPSTIDAQSAGATIADKSNDGYAGGWNAYLDYDPADSALHVGYLARVGAWAYGAGRVAATQWTHACTVWNNGTLTVVVDGEVDPIQASGTTHAPPEADDAANDLVLGRQTNTDQFHLNGTLDDFVLYDRALGSDEIRAIHACTP